MRERKKIKINNKKNVDDHETFGIDKSDKNKK